MKSLIFATSLLVAVNCWPRPEKLEVFAPLDAASRTLDIAKNHAFVAKNPVLKTNLKGPFGLTGTSHGAQLGMYSYIGYYTNTNVSSSSFTYSFYFYTTNYLLPEGLIWNNQRESFGYDGKEGMTMTTRVKKQYQTVRFPNMLKGRKWNFVAITYDALDKAVRVYNEKGSLLFKNTIEIDATEANGNFAIGLNNNDINGSLTFMTTDTALACVMAYNEVLDVEEIMQLPNVCQTKA